MSEIIEVNLDQLFLKTMLDVIPDEDVKYYIEKMSADDKKKIINLIILSKSYEVFMPEKYNQAFKILQPYRNNFLKDTPHLKIIKDCTVLKEEDYSNISDTYFYANSTCYIFEKDSIKTPIEVRFDNDAWQVDFIDFWTLTDLEKGQVESYVLTIAEKQFGKKQKSVIIPAGLGKLFPKIVYNLGEEKTTIPIEKYFECFFMNNLPSKEVEYYLNTISLDDKKKIVEMDLEYPKDVREYSLNMGILFCKYHRHIIAGNEFFKPINNPDMLNDTDREEFLKRYNFESDYGLYLYQKDKIEAIVEVSLESGRRYGKFRNSWSIEVKNLSFAQPLKPTQEAKIKVEMLNLLENQIEPNSIIVSNN